jgi:hypothetical protein
VLDLGRVAVGQMDGGLVPVIVERNQEVPAVVEELACGREPTRANQSLDVRAADGKAPYGKAPYVESPLRESPLRG